LARASGRYLRTPASLSNELRSAIRSGHGLPLITDAAKRMAAVDADGLTEVFGTCAGHEIVTVLGDAESLMAELNDAGVQASHMDWEAARDQAMQTHDPKRYKRAMRERAD